MRRTLTFRHGYAVDADRLFALVSDLDTLDAISGPWLRFLHLPSGPVVQGQVIDVGVSVFCLFPERPYRMQVVVFDPVARKLRSEESGLGIRKMVHGVQARPDGRHSVLLEHIDIDAGSLTPVVAAFVWIAHKWRHYRRRSLLANDGVPS
ncbi:hypothetical protein QO034_02185 [Sedimentitalea sp. JM2-8]|uniref:Polyketide cyclase / dehydrase and lipid transport n=1 Tax=Sedimentitalea xiamensis TaxID=3050037 RepID=A0ABT7F9W4_9RHOB|nr:hypothetical protein [Sedimentitalea xiamensis]MDK3071908.1 hypothetical protein [Sedimentitalea xiamensis]